tara:strand:- start:792 stop:935 length:144 start_codon:yes stop_codon:yes gene_type:complete
MVMSDNNKINAREVYIFFKRGRLEQIWLSSYVVGNVGGDGHSLLTLP